MDSNAAAPPSPHAAARMTTEEVARYLSVSQGSVQDWIRDGLLAAERDPANAHWWLVTRPDLERFLLQRVAVAAADDPLMTVEQVCTYLDVYQDTIYRRIAAGDIQAFELGRRAGYRFRQSEILRFIEANATDPVSGDLLSVANVATMANATVDTVRRWIKTGLLPAYRVSGDKAGYRLRHREVMRFLAHRRPRNHRRSDSAAAEHA